MGRRASNRPSFTARAMQSDTRPAPTRAATRGATSRPIDVNGTSTTAGFSAAITCATARA